ncbi:protein SSUH2 homolog [Haliotis rufescens]|uniref:protein SSUH2 homolog n=1 Tax=Haliotis rufescens TaxID=6454 RepID=UPI00201EA7A7|nr:protein SSUH2 homolog [Haliotis rufescens]
MDPSQYPGGAPPAGAVGAVPGQGPPPQGQPYPQGPGAPANYGAMNPNQTKGEAGKLPGGQAAPTPSAPSLNEMDNVGGYENVGFSDNCLPPPSYDESVQPPTERPEIKGVDVVNEDQAREALMMYVAEHCCYGKGAAETMKFTQLQPTNAFHYTMETFCESRSTAWAFEPFCGQILDTPANGPAPGPWDITPSPGPTMFQDGKMDLEVPHTSSVKACHNCCASGWIQCNKCFGLGREQCTFCNGRGCSRQYIDGDWVDRSCTSCNGRGMRTCHRCHGCGRITCTLCDGKTRLKCYIKLTILWVNHVNDHIVERTELPDHLIREVTGHQAFQETAPRVFPVNHFPDQEINAASKRIVGSHAGAFPTERILMQRHQVRIVPVTQAFFNWKEKDSDFFIYGFENKVFAPKYPQTCCWGCTIL